MSSDETLILSLIRDDLVNHKLVNGLNALGLYSAEYYLRLGQTVFHLLGIPNSPATERVYEQYQALAARVQHINIEEESACLDTLAREIYGMLRNYNIQSL